MNKIYKVVWSKVKNCYVVVSELAKNVITGSVKSAKVGAAPMARGLALGAVMAFVITGNALAAEQITSETQLPISGGSYTLGTNEVVLEGNSNQHGIVSNGASIEVAAGQTLTLNSNSTSESYTGILSDASITGNGNIIIDSKGANTALGDRGTNVITAKNVKIFSKTAPAINGNSKSSSHTIDADDILVQSGGRQAAGGHGVYVATRASATLRDFNNLVIKSLEYNGEAGHAISNNGATVTMEGRENSYVNLISETRGALATFSGGTTNIQAGMLDVSAAITQNEANDGVRYGSVLYAGEGNTNVNVNELIINNTSGIGNALYVDGSGNLALGSYDKTGLIDTIQITGNVQATSGTLTGLSLTGSDSFITGAIKTTGNKNAAVAFSDGATFNADGVSSLEEFGGSKGVIALDQSLLDTAGAVTIAKNTSEGTIVKVKDLSLKGGAKEALSGLEKKLQSAVVATYGNVLEYEASAVDVALRGDVELKNGKVTTTMDTDNLVVAGDVKAGNVSLVETAKAVAGKVDAGTVVPDDRFGFAIDSLAVGKNSIADVGGNTGYSTAVGVAAKASALSTAIGSNAEATADNSVAIGAASVADEYGTFSVGSEENKRRIVNVADGVNDYDAVNVGQLDAATANTKGISRTQYDGTTTGETKVTDDFVVDTQEGQGSFTIGYIEDKVANETNEMFIAKKLIDDGSYSTTMLINAQNGEIWTVASVTADAGMNAGKKANGTYAFSANANGAAVNGTLTTTGNTSLANGVLTATYVEGGVHEVSVQGNQKVTGGVAVGGAVAAQGDVTAGVNEKGEGGVSLLKTAADLSKLNDDVIKTNETLKTTNDNLTKLNGDVERIDAQVTENTEAIAAETEARKKDIVNVTDHINTVSTNVTEHVNAVQKDLSAAIQAETAAREEHVNAVQKDLSAAINANSAAIESNAAAIEANSQAIAIETAERKADIQNVTNHINTVQKDLSAAIDNVSANVTSHVNAVQKDLSAAINAETAAREEHVNAVQKDLSAAIQENSQAIATETEARKTDVANVTSHVNAVQKDLSNAIQAETAAREEHVNAVQKDLSSAIQAETAAREEHVNAVQKDLSSAIQENTAAISAEEQARIAGDEANAAAISNNAEAISGLNQRLGKMNGKINKVGAGAAALAALHPLDYDPDDKLTFSAGVGNYAGENAMALGAFYRPDEKLMFSLGGTMGNGENMVNLGVSIGLDGAKGTPKLSKKELVQKVSTMEAENQAIKAENEALEERVAKLEALVAKLAEK